MLESIRKAEGIEVAEEEDDHRESFYHIFQPSSSCPADLARLEILVWLRNLKFQ